MEDLSKAGALKVSEPVPHEPKARWRGGEAARRSSSGGESAVRRHRAGEKSEKSGRRFVDPGGMRFFERIGVPGRSPCVVGCHHGGETEWCL